MILLITRLFAMMALSLGNLLPPTDGPKPSDHSEWLACEKDTDCTFVELGCWYWQPVNAKHVEDMKAAHPPVCLRSVPSGPRPRVRCEKHLCEVAPYDVGYWRSLAGGPFASIRNVLLAKRVDGCVESARLSMKSESRMLWRGIFERRVDGWLREKRTGDEWPLDTVLDAAAPCAELQGWQRAQEKWWAAQNKSGSDVRVRVENAPDGASLDGLYPPLIDYGTVFARCGREFARPGARFWGDLSARFTLGPDGRIVPESFMAGFPAVAYQKRFVNCAGGPLKALVFPPPESKRPVDVEVLIQLPFKP